MGLSYGLKLNKIKIINRDEGAQSQADKRKNYHGDSELTSPTDEQRRRPGDGTIRSKLNCKSTEEADTASNS